MAAMERKTQFRELLHEHNVGVDEVAKILERSKSTIYHWYALGDKICPPKNDIRLLRFELEARKSKK